MIIQSQSQNTIVVILNSSIQILPYKFLHTFFSTQIPPRKFFHQNSYTNPSIKLFPVDECSSTTAALSQSTDYSNTTAVELAIKLNHYHSVESGDDPDVQTTCTKSHFGHRTNKLLFTSFHSFPPPSRRVQPEARWQASRV
jgi:hypothetical protein